MKENKYYKVVKNNLTSSVVVCEDKVQYKRGEYVKTHPHLYKINHHLFVFNNILSAKLFTGNNERLFECKIRGKLNNKYNFIGYSPDGTVMAKEVMIVKEIPT